MANDVLEAVPVEAKTKKVRPGQRSYFNTNKLNRVLLDDEYSYIEHKLIDEGTFEKFQDLTSTVKLDKDNSSTEVDLALGRTRRFLLECLVVGWNLVDEANQGIPFTYSKLMELPPVVIHKVIEDIYEKNDILRSDSESGKETSKN